MKKQFWRKALGKSHYKDTNYVQSPLEEKKCYTPEEDYEQIMSDVKSIYDLV